MLPTLPAGELRDYVTEELNVRQLHVCADPLQYATLRAEPDWQGLGKRLGKAMGQVGSAGGQQWCLGCMNTGLHVWCWQH